MRVNASVDVPEIEAGVRFYARVFGLVERARPFPTMAILDAGNLTICVHAKPAGSAPAPGADDRRRYGRHCTPVHLDFHVDDFDATLAVARAEGAVVEQEHRGGPHPPTAFCADPFGNGFCVIGPRA